MFSQDIEVCEPPTDSISALEFSPVQSGSSSSRLAAASWDQSVRVWDVQMDTGAAVPRCLHMMDSPVLDVAWHSAGNRLYMGDCAGKVHLLDVATNTLAKMGEHVGGVRCCNVLEPQYLMTASWDKTAKFWDIRCDKSVFQVALPGRAYAADTMNEVAVLACSDYSVLTFSMLGMHTSAKVWGCPSIGVNNSQVRAIALTRGALSMQPVGWFLAKSDGRVIMQPMHSDIYDTWSFECHRKEHLSGSHYDIYAVNDIKMNHEQMSLATVGSDGTYEFWDCTQRSRLMRSNIRGSESITKCSLSSDGKVFAYAVGYDWAQGFEYNDVAKKPKIYMRSVVEDMKSKSC